MSSNASLTPQAKPGCPDKHRAIVERQLASFLPSWRLLDLLPHELQPPSKKTHTSSLHLQRQLDLRQMAGLDEKEWKQSARRSRGGQGGCQRNRQESDDFNTKGSIQISYLRRQNDDGEAVMTIS